MDPFDLLEEESNNNNQDRDTPILQWDPSQLENTPDLNVRSIALTSSAETDEDNRNGTIDATITHSDADIETGEMQTQPPNSRIEDESPVSSNDGDSGHGTSTNNNANGRSPLSV